MHPRTRAYAAGQRVLVLEDAGVRLREVPPTSPVMVQDVDGDGVADVTIQRESTLSVFSGRDIGDLRRAPSQVRLPFAGNASFTGRTWAVTSEEGLRTLEAPQTLLPRHDFLYEAPEGRIHVLRGGWPVRYCDPRAGAVPEGKECLALRVSSPGTRFHVVRDLDGDQQPDLLVLSKIQPSSEAGAGAIWAVGHAELRRALARPSYLREMESPGEASMIFPPPASKALYGYVDLGNTTVTRDRLLSGAMVDWENVDGRVQEQLVFRTFDLARPAPTRPVATCRLSRSYPFPQPNFTDLVGVGDFDADGVPDLVFFERGLNPTSKKESGRVLVVLSPPCDG